MVLPKQQQGQVQPTSTKAAGPKAGRPSWISNPTPRSQYGRSDAQASEVRGPKGGSWPKAPSQAPKGGSWPKAKAPPLKPTWQTSGTEEDQDWNDWDGDWSNTAEEWSAQDGGAGEDQEDWVNAEEVPQEWHSDDITPVTSMEATSVLTAKAGPIGAPVRTAPIGAPPLQAPTMPKQRPKQIMMPEAIGAPVLRPNSAPGVMPTRPKGGKVIPPPPTRPKGSSGAKGSERPPLRNPQQAERYPDQKDYASEEPAAEEEEEGWEWPAQWQQWHNEREKPAEGAETQETGRRSSSSREAPKPMPQSSLVDMLTNPRPAIKPSSAPATASRRPTPSSVQAAEASRPSGDVEADTADSAVALAAKTVVAAAKKNWGNDPAADEGGGRLAKGQDMQARARALAEQAQAEQEQKRVEAERKRALEAEAEEERRRKEAEQERKRALAEQAEQERKRKEAEQERKRKEAEQAEQAEQERKRALAEQAEQERKRALAEQAEQERKRKEAEQAELLRKQAQADIERAEKAQAELARKRALATELRAEEAKARERFLLSQSDVARKWAQKEESKAQPEHTQAQEAQAVAQPSRGWLFGGGAASQSKSGSAGPPTPPPPPGPVAKPPAANAPPTPPPGKPKPEPRLDQLLREMEFRFAKGERSEDITQDMVSRGAPIETLQRWVATLELQAARDRESRTARAAKEAEAQAAREREAREAEAVQNATQLFAGAFNAAMASAVQPAGAALQQVMRPPPYYQGRPTLQPFGASLQMAQQQHQAALQQQLQQQAALQQQQAAFNEAARAAAFSPLTAATLAAGVWPPRPAFNTPAPAPPAAPVKETPSPQRSRFPQQAESAGPQNHGVPPPPELPPPPPPRQPPPPPRGGQGAAADYGAATASNTERQPPDTAGAATAPVEKRAAPARAGLYFKGDKVRYWSTTSKKWIEAIVLVVNKRPLRPNTYDLDCKKGVLASRLRPVKGGQGLHFANSEAPKAGSAAQGKKDKKPGASAAGRMKPGMNIHGPFVVGDHVVYWSKQRRLWKPSKVKKVHEDTTGKIVFYDLDHKAALKPLYVRRRPVKAKGAAGLAGAMKGKASAVSSATAGTAKAAAVSSGGAAAATVQTAEKKRARPAPTGDKAGQPTAPEAKKPRHSSATGAEKPSDPKALRRMGLATGASGPPAAVRRPSPPAPTVRASILAAYGALEEAKIAISSAASAAGTDSGKPLAAGAAVWYWSTSAKRWVKSTIKKVNLGPGGKLLSYDLDAKGQAEASKVRLHTPTAPPPLQEKRKSAADKNAIITLGKHVSKKMLPLSKKAEKKQAVKPTTGTSPGKEVAASNSAKIFNVGQNVRYFSASTNKWYTMKVEAKHDKDGETVYDLLGKKGVVRKDVKKKLMAPMPKLAAAKPPGAGGKRKGPQQATEGSTAAAPASSKKARLAPSKADGPITGQGTETATTARPTGLTRLADRKARTTSGKGETTKIADAVSQRKGKPGPEIALAQDEIVWYWSSSGGKWVKAKIEKVNRAENGSVLSYDLDAKSQAQPSRVRPLAVGGKPPPPLKKGNTGQAQAARQGQEKKPRIKAATAGQEMVAPAAAQGGVDPAKEADQGQTAALEQAAPVAAAGLGEGPNRAGQGETVALEAKTSEREAIDAKVGEDQASKAPPAAEGHGEESQSGSQAVATEILKDKSEAQGVAAPAAKEGDGVAVEGASQSQESVLPTAPEKEAAKEGPAAPAANEGPG